MFIRLTVRLLLGIASFLWCMHFIQTQLNEPFRQEHLVVPILPPVTSSNAIIPPGLEPLSFLVIGLFGGSILKKCPESEPIPDPDCPEGFTETLVEEARTCYKLITQSLKYDAARDTCRMEAPIEANGHLVSIETVPELVAVKAFMDAEGAGGFLFIDGTDMDGDGTYMLRNGAVFSHTVLGSGTKSCLTIAALEAKGIFKTDCSENKFAICESNPI